jgi:hypothetical protein
MQKKPESGLKGRYANLPKQELRLILVFFYIDLLLLIGAMVVLVMDILNIFNSNYYVNTLPFLGIFILFLFFLYDGKKNAALSALLLIPVPAYI